MEQLDWSLCTLVEIDPLRVSGRTVLKGTRMPVEDIIANYEHGVPIREISTQFQIPATIIKDLLSYVESKSVKESWDKEVARRMEDLKAGKAVTIPWEQLHRELLAIVNER